MNVLVTGAAGYVGSVVVELLLEAGHNVIGFDNLSTGYSAALPPQITFVYGDLADKDAIGAVFDDYALDAVVHMAAETVVSWSMTHPSSCFQSNLVKGLTLLDLMLDHDVTRMVFSSSAAVYGEPVSPTITEEHPQSPINPYGESKLVYERILYWYWKAYGLKSISFRYFNAAGASERRGEHHHPETHLIPNVLKVALGQSENVQVMGSDFPTPDGTAIRDYVHVLDIAAAHVQALGKLDQLGYRSYNLGTGRGNSVMEVIDALRKVTGLPIPHDLVERRPGDPAVLVASNQRAKAELGWNAAHSSLEEICESAWQWRQQHPNGYI